MTTSNERPRSPGNPTLTHHPSLFTASIPTPALLESVTGGAHYSGVKIDTRKIRHNSGGKPSNHLEVKGDHHKVIEDLQELYCCRPTREIFERRWRADARFEDPSCESKGFREYAAQWYALAKLFSKSETTSTRVLSSTSSPNRLVFAQTQVYSSRLLGQKTRSSIIIVDLDDEEKIVRLIDQRDGKELPTSFGAKFLRKAHAKITPLFIRVQRGNSVGLVNREIMGS